MYMGKVYTEMTKPFNTQDPNVYKLIIIHYERVTSTQIPQIPNPYKGL